MTAFHEDRLLGQVVDAIGRLGGAATLEQITGQLSRSGAVQMPPEALQTVVLLTLRANREGRGMGCFAQRPDSAYGLVQRASIPVRPRPTDGRPVGPATGPPHPP